MEKIPLDVKEILRKSSCMLLRRSVWPSPSLTTYSTILNVQSVHTLLLESPTRCTFYF